MIDHLAIATGLVKPKTIGLPPEPKPRVSISVGAGDNPALKGTDYAKRLTSLDSQSGIRGKASIEDAGYTPCDNCCGGCMNFTKETGDCSKVEGPVEAGGVCSKFYQAAGTSGHPDQMQLGLEPDADDLQLGKG